MSKSKHVSLSTAIATLTIAAIANKWMKDIKREQQEKRISYRYASDLSLPEAMIGTGLLAGAATGAYGGLTTGTKKGALAAAITGMSVGSLVGALNFYKLQRKLSKDPKMKKKLEKDDKSLQKRYNLILKKYDS